MSDSIEKLRAAEARLMIAAPQPRQMTPDEREWRIEREIDCIRAGLVASRSDAAGAWKLRALEAEAKLAAVVEAIDAAGRVVTGDEVQTRAQLVESLRKPTRNPDIVELIGYIDALRAARGEP